MTATIIQFHPHSRTSGHPAAQRPCVSPQGHCTNTPHLRRPAVSPEAAGQLSNVVIAVGVFGLLAAFVWWVQA